MKAVSVVFSLLAVFSSMNWIRADSVTKWPLPSTLPLLGGHAPGIYDVAGLVMIAIVAVAIFGQSHGKSDDSPAGEPEYEEVEAEEEDGAEADDDNGDEGDDDEDDEEEEED